MSNDHAVPLEPRAGSEGSVWMDTIGRLTVDGVPVFWADCPGPLRAALIFRVGAAHEELPWRGVTHLVEHLALDTLGQVPYAFNGAVEHDRTILHVSGTEEDICTFLSVTTRALAGLPVDRLDRERSILRAEAETRTKALADLLLHLRYGWTGHGMPSSDEFGLRQLTADRVTAWAARHFTAGNAALCLSGPPPEGLRLHLPPGARTGAPSTRAVEQAYPTAVHQPGIREVAFSFLGERSTGTVLAMRILERRLHDRLRNEQGVSYHVGSTYRLLDEDVAHVCVSADARKEHLDTAVQQMVATLDDLCAQGATAEELAFQRELLARADADPNSALRDLEGAAMCAVTGWPRWSLGQVRNDAAALRGDDIAEILRTASGTSLWVVPSATTIPEWRFQPYAAWSPSRVSGRTVTPTPRSTPRPANQPSSLTIGDEGVTVALDEVRAVTVRYADCAALHTWTNGDRVLQGRDGFHIRVQPADWQDGAGLVAEIDRHIDPEMLIDMGDPAPAPPRPAPSPAAVAALARRRRLLWLNLGVVIVLWLIVVGSAASGTAELPILAMAAVVSAWRTYLLVRAWRGGRSPAF